MLVLSTPPDEQGGAEQENHDENIHVLGIKHFATLSASTFSHSLGGVTLFHAIQLDSLFPSNPKIQVTYQFVLDSRPWTTHFLPCSIHGLLVFS